MKSFVRYFTGTLVLTQDLHHYIIPSLLKEKPGIIAIHVSSNNIAHTIFEGFNVNKVTGETINSGNPVDTGRKLNVHKTFRRRPGRTNKYKFYFV